MGGKVLRALSWLIGSAGLAVLALSVAIHADQYLLRRRAERLQSDIRSLELRKSTYADARKVIDRWWNDAREDGPCRADWCDVEITFSDFAWRHSEYNVNAPAVHKMLRRFGARPASVQAGIRVRNNLVLGKRIAGFIEGPCADSEGQTFCTMIMGAATTGKHHAVDVRHPEYDVEAPSGCDGPCVDVGVVFSPYARAEDVRRLTDVNFGCITRWRPCEREEDILPTAWTEARSEGPPQHVASCSESVRALTRDLGCVPLASVAHVTQVGGGWWPRLTLRWESKCGPKLLEYQNTLPQPDPDLQVRQGHRLLVFENQLSRNQPCAVVRATQENLEAAQQGLSEDLWDRPDPVYTPLGAINPPRN
jgi:hypothetical protein